MYPLQTRSDRATITEALAAKSNNYNKMEDNTLEGSNDQEFFTVSGEIFGVNGTIAFLRFNRDGKEEVRAFVRHFFEWFCCPVIKWQLNCRR